MKVYIVTDGEYSDYHIEAVFLDKRKAYEYAAVKKLHSSPDVEVWETHDDNIKVSDKEIGWITEITIRQNRYGKPYISWWGRRYGYKDEVKEWTQVWQPKNNYDSEKVHKILADRFAEFKAREAGVL